MLRSHYDQMGDILWSHCRSSNYSHIAPVSQHLLPAPGPTHTLVVSGTAPLTTRTRSLSRYFGISSVISALVAGVDSEGFNSAVFPAASAPAYRKKKFPDSSAHALGRGRGKKVH